MKKKFGLILSAITLYLAVNSAQAQTAMFGTNPQHLGVYNSSFPANMGLTKKWSYKTDGKIFSSAVVANNVVYFGSDDSCLYAIDTEGLLKWKFKSNGKICSSPAVKDTVVYFNNYGARFYAINTNTGKEIWHFETDGESLRTGKGLNGSTPKDLTMTDTWDFYLSSPVIVDTIAYFGSGANVYAINLKNSKMVWKFTAQNIVHSSPAVYDEMLYFGCWDSKLYALNATTGEEIWNFTTGIDTQDHFMEGIQSSPSVIDTIVLIGSRDANIYGIHAKTGKKIWSKSFNGSWMPSSFAILGNTLYTGSSDAGGFFSMNVFDGKINYTVKTNMYTFSTPAIANGTAFIGAMNGSLFAIDINSGKIKCKFDTDGRTKNPLNAMNPDGTLNEAAFVDINVSDYNINKEYPLRVETAGSILSTPVIDNNTVYFGSTDSTFYAVFDDGNCKPNINTTSPKIVLGATSASVIDTAIYVKNSSDCLDSAKVYINSTSKLILQAVEITPSIFNVTPNDSVHVNIRLNTNGLALNTNYTVKIVAQSKSNEYQIFNTDISLKKVISTSIISQSDDDQSTIVYPNPFMESVLIKYSLEQNCFVDVRIYSASGQLVRVLTSQDQTYGEHQLTWDGTNDEGDKLNAGLYFCSITKGNLVLNKKILLLSSL